MAKLRVKTALCFAIVVSLIMVSGAQAQTTQDDYDDGFINRENEDIRPYSWLHWGFPSWIEMLVGGAIILPFSFLRFFLPDDCGRHLTHLTNDFFEATLYWNELTMLDEGWVIYNPDDIDAADEFTINRNVYYLLANNFSILSTLPMIYNTCGSREPML